MIHFQFSLKGARKEPVGWFQRSTMNPIMLRLEDALCWTVLAPLVRARRRRMERRISQEWFDRQRIDRVLNEIVRQHADLLG